MDRIGGCQRTQYCPFVGGVFFLGAIQPVVLTPLKSEDVRNDIAANRVVHLANVPRVLLEDGIAGRFLDDPAKRTRRVVGDHADNDENERNNATENGERHLDRHSFGKLHNSRHPINDLDRAFEFLDFVQR